MNTLFFPVFLFSFIASTVFAQGLTVNSLANVVECQPSLITWTGGKAPYFLSALPAGEPNAAPLLSFGQQNGTSLTWIANLTTGTSAFLDLVDSTGLTAQSGAFTVLPGTNSNCVNSSAIPTASTGATSAVISGTTSPVSGSASASGTVGGSTTRASQGTSSSTSTGATASQSRAAAASHYAPVGTLVMTGAALVFAIVL